MDYRITCDPLYGKRLKTSDEHRLVARWFNDELHENPALSQAFFEAFSTQVDDCDVQFNGKEMRVMITHGEALFESHALHHEDEALSQWQDDDLNLDESELVSLCGLEDLQALTQAWLAFR